MRNKMMFLTGVGVGYVLGARAGRGSYESIKAQADSLWNDPRVQERVGDAGTAAKDLAAKAAGEVPHLLRGLSGEQPEWQGQGAQPGRA